MFHPSLPGIILVTGSLLMSGAGKLAYAPTEETYRNVTSSMRRGDFERGLADVLRVRTLWRFQDTEWHWKFRVLEAEILFEQGQDARARALLESNVSNCRKYPGMEVRRLVLLAKFFLRISEFARASSTLAEARVIADHYGSESLRAEVDIFRAQMLARQSRLADARNVLRSAQESAISARDGFLRAAATNGLGMVEMLLGRCDESIPHFVQARESFRTLGADYYRVMAANNLGLCYSRLGDFDRAIESRQEALRLMKPSTRMAEVLGETGRLYREQNQPREAVRYFRRALDESRRFNVPSEAARSASNLARALQELRDWDGAEEMTKQALSSKPDPRSVPFILLNRAAIASGRGRFDEARQICEGIIAANPADPTVLWQAHADLAKLHLTTGNWEEASNSFEAAIQVVEQNRSLLNVTDYRITFLARLISFYQEYVDALMDRGMSLRALEVADSSRARILAEGLSLKAELPRSARGAEELKALARRSGSIWLSYWVAPRRSFLWVITAQEIRTVVLPPEAEIAGAVERYRGFIETAMRDPLQAPNDAGRWLFQELVGKAQIPSGSRVVIVPDGPLHQLNFETLPVYEGRPRYWIEDATVAVAPSLGIAAGETPRRAPSARSLLIVGNPESASQEFPKLQYADAEVSKLHARFRGSTTRIITGSEAQPGVWFTGEPGRYSLIHIAAHGEANRRSPLDSALILSRGPQGYKLYAREIMQSPLRADLVTISACRSSGARAYAGEGLVGLARAFLQAGAGSVIAGLWDVADQSTSEIMDRMYERIAAGTSVAESLRAAKLAVLRGSYAKPYYWGPFQLYTRTPSAAHLARGTTSFASTKPPTRNPTK